jgi:site-specific DNA-methyltransferase (adenine-specific)
LQGQGFPKATNIEKQLGDYPDLQETWKGRKYGLQALKPAVEPIIVFQKPYDGRPIDNIVSTGAGALNIDGGRVSLENGDEYVINEFDDGMKPFGNGAGHKYSQTKPTQGRYPSNFILGESLSERLDSQSGELAAGVATANSGAMGYHGGRRGSTEEIGYGDHGGASRFFFRVSEQIDESDPVYYCAKVSKSERSSGLEEQNVHPTLKPISLSKYLATILLPPAEYAPRRIFVPFSGVASEMIGASLVGWEDVVGVEFDKENGYVDIAEKRLKHWCG